MKVQASIRPRCKNCKGIKRGKKRYIYCTSNASHKQRQG